VTWFDYHRRAGVCHDPATMTRRNGEPVYKVVRALADGTPVWGSARELPEALRGRGTDRP